MTNKFSINFVEQLLGKDSDDGHYHSFVALVPIDDNLTGRFEQKAQKLHFDDDTRFQYFKPNVTVERMSRRSEVDAYMTDVEEFLLPRWNHLLEQAAQIREEGYIPFNPMRTNCRSGAKAAIESIAFNFRDDFAKCAVGLGPHDFPPFEVFTFDKNNPTHTDIEVMRTHNQKLVVRLAS